MKTNWRDETDIKAARFGAEMMEQVGDMRWAKGFSTKQKAQGYADWLKAHTSTVWGPINLKKVDEGYVVGFKTQ